MGRLALRWLCDYCILWYSLFWFSLWSLFFGPLVNLCYSVCSRLALGWLFIQSETALLGLFANNFRAVVGWLRADSLVSILNQLFNFRVPLQVFWNVGCQMVSLNFQTSGRSQLKRDSLPTSLKRNAYMTQWELIVWSSFIGVSYEKPSSPYGVVLYVWWGSRGNWVNASITR